MNSSTASTAYTIVCPPGEFNEGLFGQILLYVFEVLPYLDKRKIFPNWRIASHLYADGPDFMVIPGIFDLAYAPTEGRPKTLSLAAVRATQTSVLGGDWAAVHALWHAYFRVPARIEVAADAAGLGEHTLGLHYRGQHKNALAWDTNPVSPDEFLTLAQSLLQDRPDIDSMFVATDEYAFVEATQRALPRLRLVNLGPVGFHKATHAAQGKADRALLDCVLLSRCAHVIKCSSALSGFGKVLRPDLSICRVAACKPFAEVPYFSDAYIAPMRSSRADVSAMLDKLLKDDWLEQPEMRARFGEPFAARPRRGPLRVAWR